MAPPSLALHAATLLLLLTTPVNATPTSEPSDSCKQKEAFGSAFGDKQPDCRQRGRCGGDSSSNDGWTTCQGVTSLRLTRDNEWICWDTSEFPDYQMPLVCGPENTVLPSVVTVTNETTASGSRLTLFPAVVSRRNTGSGRKTTLYTMDIDGCKCKGDLVRCTVAVTPAFSHTPASYYIHQVSVFLLLALFVFLFCLCLAIPDEGPHRRSSSSSSSSSLFLGYAMGSSSARPRSEVVYE